MPTLSIKSRWKIACMHKFAKLIESMSSSQLPCISQENLFILKIRLYMKVYIYCYNPRGGLLSTERIFQSCIYSLFVMFVRLPDFFDLLPDLSGILWARDLVVGIQSGFDHRDANVAAPVFF